MTTYIIAAVNEMEKLVVIAERGCLVANTLKNVVEGKSLSFKGIESDS